MIYKKQNNEFSSPQVLIAAPSLKLFEHLIEAKKVLELFQIPTESSIIAAHRAPKQAFEMISKLESQGIKVVIAGAEGAAHLPGMIASLTNLPVIGVPFSTSSFLGSDSMLSMIQMPKGVPIGVMGIDSSHNAGLYAVQILSHSFPFLKQKLIAYKNSLEIDVLSDHKKIKK